MKDNTIMWLVVAVLVYVLFFSKKDAGQGSTAWVPAGYAAPPSSGAGTGYVPSGTGYAPPGTPGSTDVTPPPSLIVNPALRKFTGALRSFY